MKVGVHHIDGIRSEFVVWAPLPNNVQLRIVSPEERLVPMERDSLGYWRTTAENISRGTRYFYRLGNGRDRPDPASHFQPDGVHGPSQVVDHSLFRWEDAGWRGIALPEMIMYELHTGTFTAEGTFASIIPRLRALKTLGINSIEIMPVAQFPGERNWGYDGVYPFAVQNSYGGPDGLKKFVNACHKNGMAVILDVVYNHLGPEGNYLWDFGPYFTDKYRTPWGQAINFDDACSNEVRNFFVENALHWFSNYHIDALRLDAIHGISDLSAVPFLQELAAKAGKYSARSGRKFLLIAESDLNDSRTVRPRIQGGLGLDAQWCDDFHHSLHTLLTGEREGYYKDFGEMGHMIKSFKEGFVYSGGYSEYRKRNHGNSSRDIPARKLVVFSQNHDQVGNRMLGERLTTLVSFESLKLAAGAVLLSPYIPLLFMGEEYGEESPFLYFISHSDPGLIEAVRKGRREEFNAFTWKGEPPDPWSTDTFHASKVNWKKRKTGMHRVLLNFYRHLILLRHKLPALSGTKKCLEANASWNNKSMVLIRWKGKDQTFCILNFSAADESSEFTLPGAVWRKVIESSGTEWKGPGALAPDKIIKKDDRAITLRSRSFVVYEKERL
jgi:maltooligosyltrehalose trehalohydrolase